VIDLATVRTASASIFGVDLIAHRLGHMPVLAGPAGRAYVSGGRSGKGVARRELGVRQDGVRGIEVQRWDWDRKTGKGGDGSGGKTAGVGADASVTGFDAGSVSTCRTHAPSKAPATA